MNYISTTELRTKSRELVNNLKKGESVPLVHRSRIVGIIEPAFNESPPILDIEKFKKDIRAIKPKRIIARKNREKIYRAHLEEKYGKSLP